MKVLLVEDDPRDAKLTMRALMSGSASIEIELVEDGEQALDFLFCRGAYSNRQAELMPKLILLDLKLPKVNGVQVLEEIKSHPDTLTIPVVVLTSSRERKDLAVCYRLGVNSYIQKPLDFDSFQETIKALSIYWITINEPAPANEAN